MTEDLDELLMAYLDHWDELRRADRYIEGSSVRYYHLRTNFEEKYSGT